MKWIQQRFDVLLGVLYFVTVVAVAALLFVAGIYELRVLMLVSVTVLLLLFLVGIYLRFLPDKLRSQENERILRIASSTLDRMRGGLTFENCQGACELLLPETRAMAIAMTDRERVMGYCGEDAAEFPVGGPIHTPATRHVLKTGRVELFTAVAPGGFHEILGTPTDLQLSARQAKGVPAGIVVPLNVGGEVVGTIKFYYRRSSEIDRTQQAIACGFGELLSTQLLARKLELQAELTAKAEVKALQAQINPHFLFNTLNTIISILRTDPERARMLLREFSGFYRQTLTGSNARIPLARELEQTHRYLTLERARFGEDRIVQREYLAPGCENVTVPSFIIQPLVENSVRHAMREEGTLHIEIHVTIEDKDVLIAVADDGNGMEEEIAGRLIEPLDSEGTDSLHPANSEPFSPEKTHAVSAAKTVQTAAPKQGTGIALRNVAERVERFYGIGSGVEIMSKPGEGTCVTLRLARAALQDS